MGDKNNRDTGEDRRDHATIDATDLGRRLVHALEEQTDAIDNHAGSLDDLRELLEALSKKLKLGSIVSSLLGKKKT